MDEERKPLIWIMAAILTSLHMHCRSRNAPQEVSQFVPAQKEAELNRPNPLEGMNIPVQLQDMSEFNEMAAFLKSGRVLTKGQCLQARFVLGDCLRRNGYRVECAPDGNTGFQKATSLPFDLMILDIMLPGRSGLDLCRDIRGVGLGKPILMLTACRETEVKVASFKAGADDYVTKPFDMLELIARIEALLRRVPSEQVKVFTSSAQSAWI